MLRRFVSAAAVLFVVVGLVFAGEYNRAQITKYEDGKVTFKYKKDKDDTEFVEKTIKVSKDVKITRKGKDGDTEVKAEDFKELVEKMSKGGKGKGGKGKGGGGAFKIETTGEGDAETVTAITVGGRGKGK